MPSDPLPAQTLPAKIHRTTAHNLITIDVGGVPVRKGTVVIPCACPLYVGIVIRVTPQGHVYVRWFNTRTLEQETLVELTSDTHLRWLVPFQEGEMEEAA